MMKTWYEIDENGKMIPKVNISVGIVNHSKACVNENNICFKDENGDNIKFYVYIDKTFIACPIDNLSFSTEHHPHDPYEDHTCVIEGTLTSSIPDTYDIVFWKGIKRKNIIIIDIDSLDNNIVLNIDTFEF